jgi:hypothetical protein
MSPAAARAALALLLALLPITSSTAVSKLGVYDYMTEESSPIIFNDALVMLESIPTSYADFSPAFASCTAYFRVRDMKTLTVIVNISASCGICFGAATVVPGATPGAPETLVVTGTEWDRTASSAAGALGWSGPCAGPTPVNCTVHVFSSSSPQLEDASWSHAVVAVPFGVYNTDVTAVPAAAGGGWTMALETTAEHARFLVSAAADPTIVSAWSVLNASYTIPHFPDTGSCPSIRHDGEFFYYLTGGRDIQILRSRDLLNWTESNRSVILHTDPGDCVVAPPYFGPYVPVGVAAAHLAACGVAGNFGDDSDVDLVEWPAPFGDASNGPAVLLEYGSGDQRTFGFSNLAIANGTTLNAFLRSFF